MANEGTPAAMNLDENSGVREDLLAHLKKEVKNYFIHKKLVNIFLHFQVKQLMEEAVMKRFIHEEGGTVTALCVAVESCLAHGLKRRVFGLFGTTSTFGLLHKISSLCPPAASVVKMVIQIEQKYWKVQK